MYKINKKMPQSQLTNQLFTALIRNLPRLSVSLAEYEYLYDPASINSGEIDPNVLSAGGFPAVLLKEVLRRVDIQLQQEAQQYVLSDLEFLPEFLKLEKLLDLETNNQFLRTAVLLKDNDESWQEYQRRLEKDLLPDLSAVIKEIAAFSHLKEVEIRAKLLGSVAGWARVNPIWWHHYQLKLVEAFFQAAQSNQDIGPFKSKALQQMVEFVEIFTQESGLLQSVESGQPRVICKVPWESSLGYAAAYVVQRKHPTEETQVWMDIHANTGFYSLIPQDSRTIGWSRRQIREEKPENIVNTKDGKHKIKTSKGELLPLFTVKSASQVIAQAKVYNVEAYFWDHHPLSTVDLDDPCQRWLYLANILNAKLITLSIYQRLELELGWKHRRPQTQLLKRIDLGLKNTFLSKQSLVFKEAGQCSTGGHGVELINLPDHQTSVLQQRVDSYLFARLDDSLENPQPLHGHVRNISIVSSYGKMVNVGFVVKLSDGDKFNSSAYRSYQLAFNYQGRFIFGTHIAGNKILHFDQLAEGGLQPLLSWKQWQDLLKQARLNWMVSTLYLNIFWANNPEQKLKPLFDQELIKANLWPKRGFVFSKKQNNPQLSPKLIQEHQSTLSKKNKKERRTNESPPILPKFSGATTGFSQCFYR